MGDVIDPLAFLYEIYHMDIITKDTNLTTQTLPYLEAMGQIVQEYLGTESKKR